MTTKQLTQMTVAFEKWTPTKAREILERGDKNRTIKPKHIERFIYDQTNGNWPITPEAITISEDGELMDGQHRLTALVQAGVSLVFLTCRNAPASLQLFIDQGKPRSMADSACLEYKDTDPISRKHEAVTRMMMDPKFQSNNTRTQELAFFQEHESVIRDTVEMFVGLPKHCQRAQVIAVVARASYTEDHARLGHLVSILKEPIGTLPADRAAVVLRDELAKFDWSGNSMRRGLYARCEFLTRKFLDRRSGVSGVRANGDGRARLTPKCVATEELFLLPGESV